jgi:Flp pilus assembly protein TadB
MGHYWLHAASVPWQNQLLYGALILAAIVLLFFVFWWRKRASRPAQGDFAALATQANVSEALAAQDHSPLADAADAWEQTQTTMAHLRSGVERGIALMLAVLSGLLFLISASAVLSFARDYPDVAWGTLAFYLVLGAVCGWFMRVQWREFRAK